MLIYRSYQIRRPIQQAVDCATAPALIRSPHARQAAQRPRRPRRRVRPPLRARPRRLLRVRMEELGIPDHLHGTRDLEGDGRWTAFIARDRQGGSLLEGIAVNSGCLNPQLLKGKPGARLRQGDAERPDRRDHRPRVRGRQAGHSRRGFEAWREDGVAGHGRGEADSEGDGEVGCWPGLAPSDHARGRTCDLRLNATALSA